MTTTTNPPPGYSSVTPWLIVRDAADYLDFLAEAFDAQELGRVPNPDGTIGHAETRIGDSVVMVFDTQDGWPPTTQYLRLYVDDAAATWERAVAAGCIGVTPLTALAFGDVVGRLSDPWGNLWWVQQRLEDVAVEELMVRLNDPQHMESMAAVQASLSEEMRRRGSDPVLLGRVCLLHGLLRAAPRAPRCVVVSRRCWRIASLLRLARHSVGRRSRRPRVSRHALE